MVQSRRRAKRRSTSIRRQRKVQEIALKAFGRVRVDGWIEEHATELLARSQNLPTARAAPTLIGSGQIKELQRTRKGSIETYGVSRCMRSYRPLHFAAHVAELLHQRKRGPAIA